MNRFCIIYIFIVSVLPLSIKSQTINFNYDENGNRVLKKYLSPIPDTPHIVLNGTQLLSDVANHNQWYYNDSGIVGATSQHYNNPVKGKYYVRVFGNYGCISAPSNSILINTYIFNGSGNWNVISNWMNQSQPPSNLPSGNDIIIDPKPAGQCSLNVPQIISPGGTIRVKAGKNFIVNGSLTIQQ
jgi:hypothetical protein